MARQIPSDIQSKQFDVIIIGAGINGAGIARDAALRGAKVLLLDKADIASGTTSWSTRLIHGGLRYLEYGELGLVRESLRERERLFHNAPHLVRPLRMMIPIYEHDKRGPRTIRLGMIAYDLLSFDKSLERHRMFSREATLHSEPNLNPTGLKGSAIFYDAQVEYAERLAVENALSARNHSAVILSYARVNRLIVENGAVRGVEFTDLLAGGIYEVRASVTVNVAGPWVDQVLAGLDRSLNRMIGGTKGSHIIVSGFPGNPKDALYVEALKDQRPFFIIPWNGRYLIGTTDSRYEGDLDQVEASDDEIDYLIAETNQIIPCARLSRSSIVFSYSGIRPLPYVEAGSEAGITRRHIVHDHAPELGGLVSIVGGKLTTYRSLSESTVNLLFKKLGRKSPGCMTANRRLPGSDTDDFTVFCEQFKANSGLATTTAERLLRIYGTRAAEVLDLAAEGPELSEPFSPETGAIGAEILMSFRREMAETLCDCLLRRTMVGLGASVGLDADDAAAELGCKYLGWDDRRAEREVASYQKYVERYHARCLAGHVGIDSDR